MRLDLWRNYETSYLKKTEVEVLPVVDLLEELASVFFVGDATRVCWIAAAVVRRACF